MQNKLLPLALFLFSLTPSTLACNTIGGIKLTNYGYPDASGTPAYKCNGNKVLPSKPGDKTELGDGSFKNPYAAASADPSQSFLNKCELIYVPLLKKYFRVQDNCSGCVDKQVDLYLIQSNKNIGQTQCELDFGDFNYGHPLHEVVREPGAGFETNTQPLFVNGKCYNKVSDGRVFPSHDGHVKCSSDGSEVDSNADVDGTADNVDTSGSKNDDDAQARHQGTASATESGSGSGSSKAPQATKAVRSFEA